jgi:ATP-dependent Clp protease ATP-binding subunit ClpC
MFERFTERARRVMVLAQDEARLLNHNYIGTEHILLGLVHEGDGVAARALRSLGISLDAVRFQVAEMIGRGESVSAGHIPFTPRAKKVLELSLREALQLGDNYIGTQHILLGVIREGEGVAAQVLQKLGASLPGVREVVIRLLSGSPTPEIATPSGETLEDAGRVEELALEEAAALGDDEVRPEHRRLAWLRIQMERLTTALSRMQDLYERQRPRSRRERPEDGPSGGDPD